MLLRGRSRAARPSPRVDRMRPAATPVLDGWPSPGRPRGRSATESGVEPDSSAAQGFRPVRTHRSEALFARHVRSREPLSRCLRLPVFAGPGAEPRRRPRGRNGLGAGERNTPRLGGVRRRQEAVRTPGASCPAPWGAVPEWSGRLPPRVRTGARIRTSSRASSGPSEPWERRSRRPDRSAFRPARTVPSGAVSGRGHGTRCCRTLFAVSRSCGWLARRSAGSGCRRRGRTRRTGGPGGRASTWPGRGPGSGRRGSAAGPGWRR